jgi:hypothetical protein
VISSATNRIRLRMLTLTVKLLTYAMEDFADGEVSCARAMVSQAERAARLLYLTEHRPDAWIGQLACALCRLAGGIVEDSARKG